MTVKTNTTSLLSNAAHRNVLIIGASNGAALAPLTVFRVVRIRKENAGAASGLVNIAHQIGGTQGLSLLIIVFSIARTPELDAELELSHQIHWALLGAAFMMFGGALVTLKCMLQKVPQTSLPRSAP